MIIPLSRKDTSLPLPAYQTPGAVGFDLMARTTVTIEAKQLGFVPLNIVVKVPEGHMLMLASRSSLAKKKGLMLANSVGIIDQDYHGPDDELLACLYNFTDQPVTIEIGERIVQGVFVQITQGVFEEGSIELTENRGGFGSTGK